MQFSIEVDEEYDEKPKVELNPASACPHMTMCLKMVKDIDSIIFDGKLTAVPTKYTAKLKDSKNFTFVFGTEAAPPAPPVEVPTVKPTTSEQPSANPQPQPETEHPEPQPGTTPNHPDNHSEPIPPEHTTPPCESTGNGNNGGGEEQETVPTTSSARLNMIPAGLTLLVFFHTIL